MTDKQEHKLRMYYAVSAVCETNAELWQENEAFTSSYKKFQSKIPLIQKYGDILKMEAIASESFKCFDRIELEEMGFYFSMKLLEYARETNNEMLVSEILANRNALMKASDNELIAICNILVMEASKYVQNLNSFGINPENITEFQNFVNYFSKNYNRLRHVISKNKTAEELLKKTFKEIEEIIKEKLDPEIEYFKNSYPGFYEAFRAARVEYNPDLFNNVNTSDPIRQYS
jgi:hypothetical protein